MFYLVIKSVYVKGKLAYEEEHRYPTTEKNDPLTAQHVLIDLKWLSKANRIYKVWPDSTCEVIKGDNNYA